MLNQRPFIIAFCRSADESIDYRCDNRHFLLSAQNCQVPTPTSQNLKLEQQIQIFQLANSAIDRKIEIHNSKSADLFTKKGEF
jgi:hypothetical protein